MAYEVGASLSIRNVLNLTPLTLSAKLARIEMFFHILNIEREIYWQIGSITCAAYPLSQVDTIDVNTGNISNNSALNLVVFGVSHFFSLVLLLSISKDIPNKHEFYKILYLISGEGWTLGTYGRCPGRSIECQMEYIRKIKVKRKEAGSDLSKFQTVYIF